MIGTHARKGREKEHFEEIEVFFFIDRRKMAVFAVRPPTGSYVIRRCRRQCSHLLPFDRNAALGNAIIVHPLLGISQEPSRVIWQDRLIGSIPAAVT